MLSREHSDSDAHVRSRTQCCKTRVGRTRVDDLDDVVAEFLVESTENLDRLDQGIVELEANPNSPDLVASIFRSVHTIKGTSGFFGFDRLESVSHAGETLLSAVRDGA